MGRRWKEHAPKEERDAAHWEVQLQLVPSGQAGQMGESSSAVLERGKEDVDIVDEIPPEMCRGGVTQEHPSRARCLGRIFSS